MQKYKSEFLKLKPKELSKFLGELSQTLKEGYDYVA